MTTTATSMGASPSMAASRPAERRPAAPAKKAAPRSSNRVLMVLIGVLIAIAVMGTGSAFVFGKGFGASGRSQTANAKTTPTYAALPVMSFSFADGNLMHRLRLKVLLELDPSLQASAVDPVAPRIVNAVNMRMSSIQANDLTGPGGTRLVKDAVAVAANRELQPIHIKQVLVQEMLMN